MKIQVNKQEFLDNPDAFVNLGKVLEVVGDDGVLHMTWYPGFEHNPSFEVQQDRERCVRVVEEYFHDCTSRQLVIDKIRSGEDV